MLSRIDHIPQKLPGDVKFSQEQLRTIRAEPLSERFEPNFEPNGDGAETADDRAKTEQSRPAIFLYLDEDDAGDE
jgi:hypothetical protein